MAKTKTEALSGSGGHPGRMNTVSAKKHWSVKLREELTEVRRQRDLMFDVVARVKEVEMNMEEMLVYGNISFGRDAEKVIWAGKSTWREGELHG